MQEKVLEQLKIKYEYLDFDNAIVLTCFHNAVEEFKRENSAAFDNANIAGLELEHYFLYYLVLEMQKGNQEIYDAVSIGMEYINDFVIRRRKDLVSSFNKEQQKAFYDEAFKNTINGYYKKMSLTSALTQNLLQVYNVAKEGYKEVSSMKYNLKLKSIYEVFSEYDVDILKTVLKAFQKEGMSYRVLVKKYGKNLDGEGAASFLTYADSSKLERILSRIESWLIYAQYLYNKEDSLDSIYQFFNKTSDEKLVHILTNYQKKTEEKVNLFSSKNDIMTKYQISEEILSDSLEFVEDKKYRILYKYTYGINCKKMKKESILDMLGINLDLYQRGLLMVQKQLPTLISKAKKSLEEALPQGLENNTSKPKKPSLLNHETKEQPKPIPNNIANDVMTDTSKQEKKEEPVKIIEDEPIKSKKKNKQYLKQYFIEYLYTEGMTEEEKQNLSKRLSSILDKLKKNNAKGFEILEKLYGPNLDQPLSDYFVPKNKKSLFYSFIHSTQRLLSVEYKNRMAKKVTSKKELKQDFKDYFYKEGMSQEEKDQVMEKLTKALLFNQNSTAYQILYKLYDENLLLKKDVEASKNEKISITKFIKRLSKDMEADLDILLKQSKKAKRPTSFFEYFYEEGMSQEEKEEIKEKILLFLKESTLASVDIIYKLYGENLDTLNKNAEISKSELANLSYLKSSIKKYLISGHIRSKSNRPSTFFEYFYEEGMTEEEKELLEKEILEIIEAKKEEQTYFSTQSIYGKDFKTLQKKYTQNDSGNCIRLKKYVEAELEKRKENLIVSDKKSFPDIPPVEENLIEEIEENEEIVDEIEEVIEKIDENEEIVDEIEEEIEENISQEEDFLESDISYMDSLILKLYNASYTREEIKKVLSIDDDTLIDSYINHLDLFDDINSILDFILINYPNRIKDILQSNYYASFMESLTEKEQEVVYLKLLSKTNPTFTDEMISILTEIPLEEIQDYQIMTKDNSLNRLNEYLKRPLLKKEFQKIKESQK